MSRAGLRRGGESAPHPDGSGTDSPLAGAAHLATRAKPAAPRRATPTPPPPPAVVARRRQLRRLRFFLLLLLVRAGGCKLRPRGAGKRGAPSPSPAGQAASRLLPPAAPGGKEQRHPGSGGRASGSLPQTAGDGGRRRGWCSSRG